MDKNISFVCCLSPHLVSTSFMEIQTKLEKEFGKISCILPNVGWEPPKSYQNEMKGIIKTSIIVFKNPFILSEFVELKKCCMDLEFNTSIGLARTFNLNPGYLSNYGMYLATHKPSKVRFREYLMDNVWQEKQYDFLYNTFFPNSNTFSEYLNVSRIMKLNRLFLAQNNSRNSKSHFYNHNKIYSYIVGTKPPLHQQVLLKAA